MRHASIPGWTVLREHSSSSAAPSEDELQGQSSQDGMASNTHRPPLPTRTQDVAGPSGMISGGNVGGSNSSSRIFNSAPRTTTPTTSTHPRRPLSDNDEDEFPRPKKRKKRRIINTEEGGVALANTKVPAPPSTITTRLSQTHRPPPSTALAPNLPLDLARGRRQTLDIGALDRQRGQQNTAHETEEKQNKKPTGQVPSTRIASSRGDPSSTSNRSKLITASRQHDPGLQRLDAQKSADCAATFKRDDELPPQATARRCISAPAQPPSPEIIEILDSDYEDAPPHKLQPPAAPTQKPPTRARKTLPCRTTMKRRVPLPANVVIVLDDSDDDRVPPAPSCLKLPSTRTSPAAPIQHAVDPLRAETASPVSSILDPRLQDLAITATPAGDLGEPASSGSFSANTLTTPSASRRSVTPRAPKYGSVIGPRLRMRGALYAGSDGFFSSVLRQSRKRWAKEQSRVQSTAGTAIGFVTSVRASPITPPKIPKIPSRLATPSEKPVDVAAPTSREFPIELIVNTEQAPSPTPDWGLEQVKGNHREQTSTLSLPTSYDASKSTFSEAAIVSPTTAREREPIPALPEEPPTNYEPIAPIADNPRSDPPSVEIRSSIPLGKSLSQIIRNAMNANALQNPIDLTNSDDETFLETVAVPNEVLPASTQAPSSVPPVSTAPAATPQPVKTIDLTAIRSIRKFASSQHLPQFGQHSPIKENIRIPPLPRNMRRVSTLAENPRISVPRPWSQFSASASATQSVLPSHASSPEASSAPLTPALTFQTSSKLVLPRRNVVRSSQPMSGIPSVQHTSTTKSSMPFMETPDRDVNPPRSPTEEHTDTTEEPECLDHLTYPSTPDSVDDEMEEEDDHPVLPPTGRRMRSQAASNASSGPRRSVRLSSSSASSSVEPLDEADQPRGRIRRREPYIRTSSEEDIVAHGGIPYPRNNIAQAFEDAGFGALSWRKDKRRIAKEHAPITQLAENIPHDLHDCLNALSAFARQAGNMQVLIFEAEICANTAGDEPDAPPIRIINEVDDEPTPPLEFYYSNLMWHGRGVPKPDYDILDGCGCIGPCDPMSKTCSCIKQQKKYWGQGSGFIYDKRGRLRANEYPIFECNMNCGCSDDCPNRVIQHGRQHEISIQKTPNKGWGIFAGSKKIPANSYIGVYAGEYLLDADGEARGRIYNKFGRTYLFDIDFYYLNQDHGHNQVPYCIDAYHAGNFTRYLNHSCDPNCVIVAAYINEANLDKPLLTIFTKKDVEPYEEICFSYFGDGDLDDLNEDDDSDGGTSKVYNGAVYVKCQCGAENCRGNMWK